MHLMELLGEWVMLNLISIHLATVLVSVEDWCKVCGKQPWLRNRFGRSRWYSKVTRLKWNLISVRLEIVIILKLDRCTVCAEHTTNSEIIMDAPDRTPT